MSKFGDLLADYGTAQFDAGDWRDGEDLGEYQPLADACEEAGDAIRAHHGTLIAALRTARVALEDVSDVEYGHPTMQCAAIKAINEALKGAE